jgi:hypothetical protein
MVGKRSRIRVECRPGPAGGGGGLKILGNPLPVTGVNKCNILTVYFLLTAVVNPSIDLTF